MQKMLTGLLVGARTDGDHSNGSRQGNVTAEMGDPARFGYYVAAAEGFYEEEGLDVEIKPGGPDIALRR